MQDITIKGAREHNLKNLDLTLPRNKFIVVTGLSGSGKSTLAFDTLYAEGQRRYVESLSAYARQFLGLMNKPDVDSIEGLSPAISIEQKTTSKNPRSTVGTTTEIYDYLRLLFARVGEAHCPEHDIKIEAQTPEKIADKIQEDFKNTKSFAEKSVLVLAPIIRQKKGTYKKTIKDLAKEGFSRARVDGKIYRVDEKIKLARYKKHDIDIVVDRVELKDRSRLVEAVETAVNRAEGLVVVSGVGGPPSEGRGSGAVASKKKARGKNKDSEQSGGGHISGDRTYSANMACPICGMSFEELQPRMFSFNSPFGACETCDGLGVEMVFDPDLIIPDKTKNIADGAIVLYRNAVDGWRGQYLGNLANNYGFDIFTPIEDLTEEQYNVLMHGSKRKIKFEVKAKNGTANWSHVGKWEGLIPQSERLYKQTNSDYRRKELEKFMRVLPCPSCKGKRLKRKVLSVKIANKSITDVTEMSISECKEFFYGVKLSSKQLNIAKQVLKEIKDRLEFLENVGLGYLTLSRSAGTLSGGESQRIRLATQIGSNLTGVMYILDEPSIGLHPRDNAQLISTLKGLRDIGNTLIVVEHDEETIRTADYVVDLGPGAGVHGGEIVSVGSPREIEKDKQSLTGEYLSGKRAITVPSKRRKGNKYIKIVEPKQHNLKGDDVHIPVGVFTVVTGVSGSGKSTLVHEVLYKGLKKKLLGSRVLPGKHKRIDLDTVLDKVIVIDQSPIGKTPRSNPATYTKVFDDIRKLYSQTKESQIRGYKPGRFSFNTKGGRCEACQGNGVIKIEMNFLPDVYVKCEECNGRRFNSETLEVRYKDKTISDVLAMTIEEGSKFFKNIPKIQRKLEVLDSVGLGYIRLGQSSTTLSGGESQRIKLTRELSKRGTGNTLYLLDEPTTGLHFHDVKKLLAVLQSLVDKGNSVVVIEHNLDVIKSADYIVDLGPEGGDKGGYVVAVGTPEEVATNSKSHTGRFLRDVL